MKKLHISEILILIIYLIVLVFWFSFNRSVDLFNVDPLNDKVFEYSLIALIVLSNWSIFRLKRVSMILWPFYILLGLHVGPLGGDVQGSTFGVFVRALISIVILSLQLFSCLIFARKDFLKIFTISSLSFIFIFALDLIFINPKEMDAKGDYASWRLRDFGTSYVEEVDTVESPTRDEEALDDIIFRTIYFAQ